MKIAPKVSRFFFYGLIAAGVLFLCATLTLRTFTSAGEIIGLNSMWLAGLCCVIPFVLAGIALSNESL